MTFASHGGGGSPSTLLISSNEVMMASKPENLTVLVLIAIASPYKSAERHEATGPADPRLEFNNVECSRVCHNPQIGRANAEKRVMGRHDMGATLMKRPNGLRFSCRQGALQ